MIDTSKPPMVHRIHIPRPYEPSFDTDIRRAFRRERERLAREAFAREFNLQPLPGRIGLQKHHGDDERMYVL